MISGPHYTNRYARAWQAALVAGVLGLAPLAASSAAGPADGAVSLEVAADTGAAVEMMPLVGTPAAPPPAFDAPAAFQPMPEPGPVATRIGSGSASYYAAKFNGRRTASGESFDNRAMTAAHRTLPFGSLVRVTNPANGRSVTVRINDRGPFTRGRLIDLSRAAAEELGMVARGHAAVDLDLIAD